MNPVAPVLDVVDASFGYDDRTVVEHVSVAQRPGEVVALLGPNGSGKSTLVRGLLGLADHSGGEVRLFGVAHEGPVDDPRVGYVPQHHSLSTAVRATVREIVEVGLSVRRPWWHRSHAGDRERVDAALDAVGLAGRGREDVASLSGGQQRRVLIARAVVSEPRLLLLDEPTAGVDRANQLVLAAVLRRLAEAGTAVLVVTHELEALEDAVTRVVCLQDGRVDFDGSKAAYAAHVAAVGHGTGVCH